MSYNESIYFKIPKTDEKGFFIQYEELPHFYDHLHHHPELQLFFVIEGTGSLFIGDSITPFKNGDLFMIGSNQNHLFKSDPEYFESDYPKKSKSISVFFHDQSLGKNFFEISEMSTIQHLLKNAKRGLQFSPKIAECIEAQMCSLLREKKGFTRFIKVLKILNKLAETNEYEYLAEVSNSHPPTDKECSKINGVINYIFNHYKEDIKLDEIADIAHYSKAAFCTFFKQHTRKTFSQFLNEVRISQACKMLKETDMNISQIGFECGYNNISHFNRQFKKYTGLTPRKYSKKFERSLEDPSEEHYFHYQL